MFVFQFVDVCIFVCVSLLWPAFLLTPLCCANRQLDFWSFGPKPSTPAIRPSMLDLSCRPALCSPVLFTTHPCAIADRSDAKNLPLLVLALWGRFVFMRMRVV